MTTPAFGNPVRQAVIRPYGSPDIYGSFHVTAAFGVIDASHPVPHQGTDIGDGKCGDDALAMATGKVSYAGGTFGIIRIVWDDDPTWEPAIAHCVNILVKVGDHVTQGQKIASIGGAGGFPCHGHLGCKHNGVEVDIWPHMAQNQAGGEMIPIWGANFKRIVNKKSTLKFSGNFRDERKSGKVLELYPAGAPVYPIAYANDGDVPSGSQSGEWWACFMYVKDRGVMFGWFHSSLVNPLVDDVTTSGITQAKYDADVAALNARIAGIKKKVASGASDIAND